MANTINQKLHQPINLWGIVFKHSFQTIIGFTALCLLAWIMFGANPAAFVQAIIFLSICTFGIPLILTIFVSYGLGWLICFFFEPRGKNDSAGRDQTAITDYIINGQANGKTKQQIIDGLVNIGGWRVEDVENAYKELENKKAG